ncbi:unnamed protein product [Prorocentrum cordatum]|uniref:Uncharacterized protein n=1 Tax=Prorocentrum cordatum TaxID=2364126 RepID=A0ABN9WL50_9DINO|nr:unnamed protein product [Polarella glacialis]
MAWPKEVVEMAVKLGYVIGVRSLETRQECERVVLPVPFVRMFPRFVYMVEQYVFHMEQVLLEINTCLGETHNTNKLNTAKHAFDNEGFDMGKCITEENKLSMVTERAKYATRLVRKFLIRLGAEDPRRRKFKPGVLPLSGAELQLIHQNNFHFAPMANLMAMDYVAAFGVGVIEEVRLRNDFIRNGDILKYPGRVAGGEPWMFQLEGYFWQYAQELRPELLAIANPLNRISSSGPPERLRPPVEYTEALVFTAQLARNGFCTPNTGLLKVDAVFQRSKQSWSDRISSERCFIGRVRPGDFFIQIMRCKGTAGGQEGDFGNYVDWRIRFQGVLLKGDLLTPEFSGVGGNVFTSGSMLTAATMSGAAVAAGITSGAAVEALAPMVLNSSIAGTVLFAGASVAPMVGIGAAAFLTTGGGFKEVCQALLAQLSSHGVVSSSGWAEPPHLGLNINVALVTWGAVVYRLKSVKIKTGDGIYQDRVKSQKFTSLHFESWNRAELSPVVPFVGSVELYGKVELDWDLTPWVERMINRRKFLENKQRQEKCVSCLKAGKAFCDWRKPLESIWDETYDVCVDHSSTEEQTCERDIGMVDDVGDVVTAEYFSPKLGSAACMEIDFVRANREFRLNDLMRRFFRRH